MAVLGASPASAVADRVLAAAPLDPALPPKWSPIDYATWSARLAGLDARDAAERAKQAASLLQLGGLATTPTARIPIHAKRATVVAAAIATGARVIVLEDPIGGLPEEVSRTWSRILVAALRGLSFVVFAPRVPLTSPLALDADEAVVVSGARVDAQGAPAEVAAAERRYVARVHGPIDALAPKLAARGARVEGHGTAAHVVFDLGETMTTSELLAVCGEARVTVVELLPVARALA
jgi:ABC-2 type transport system ATP-binding protein